MDELTTQITEEVLAITNWLQEYLSRPSRWNGKVELTDDAAIYGKALSNGIIMISREIVSSELRWRTELHEALHHFSIGLSATSYLDLPGWEEGIVEQLQRTLRHPVFNDLGIDAPPSVFAVIETDHQFNRYIKALESMRVALRQPLLEYYVMLLWTPLKARPAHLVDLGRLLPSGDFRDFQRVFALSFSVLRGD
ncbi:MAG: hypothetical protein ACRYFS_19210 [Janthinobacterium lividum]